MWRLRVFLEVWRLGVGWDKEAMLFEPCHIASGKLMLCYSYQFRNPAAWMSNLLTCVSDTLPLVQAAYIEYSIGVGVALFNQQYTYIIGVLRNQTHASTSLFSHNSEELDRCHSIASEIDKLCSSSKIREVYVLLCCRREAYSPSLWNVRSCGNVFFLSFLFLSDDLINYSYNIRTKFWVEFVSHFTSL
jgi:hypothetical protein